MTKTLSVPEAMQKYSKEELLHFLKRGQYDVEYRHKRNKRLAADRELLKKLRDEGTIS